MAWLIFIIILHYFVRIAKINAPHRYVRFIHVQQDIADFQFVEIGNDRQSNIMTLRKLVTYCAVIHLLGTTVRVY